MGLSSVTDLRTMGSWNKSSNISWIQRDEGAVRFEISSDRTKARTPSLVGGRASNFPAVRYFCWMYSEAREQCVTSQTIANPFALSNNPTSMHTRRGQSPIRRLRDDDQTNMGNCLTTVFRPPPTKPYGSICFNQNINRFVMSLSFPNWEHLRYPREEVRLLHNFLKLN